MSSFAGRGCIAAISGALFLSAVEPSPPLATVEEIEHFLQSADVIRSRPVGKGSTHPVRLTLSDGTSTHDAAFQSIDERAPTKALEGGTEVKFADSYHFNIAAYELARLLGLDDMVPVSVERKWNHKTGSLTWWVPNKWDENEWKASGISPPDLEAWNRQIFKVRVFAELVYDTDRNRSNMLITEDWKIWMIDFTRAFRPWHRLQSIAGLERCDRALLDRLRALDRKTLVERLSRHLKASEIEGLLARRDLLAAHYDALVRERGEARVLYGEEKEN